MVLGLLSILLLPACSQAPEALPVGQVHGRTWSSRGLGVALDFDPGWQLAVKPEHFRSELPGTVLEARHEELSVALTWQPLPALGPLEGLTALDLLPGMQPVDTEAPGYRLERVPGCPALIERRAGELVQFALRVDSGLLVFQGWGGEFEPLRELACGVREL